MSGVTRCPDCGTAFRISDAQLAARSGQARCGRCGKVFDARLGLVAGTSTPPAPATKQGRGAEALRLASAQSTLSRPAALDVPPPAQSTRRSKWIWSIATAIALVALAVQFAFHFRGEIVLLWPALKPTLAGACAELGCDLPLPRLPELMSIEASDLQADGTNPGVMVLSATLRNRAAFPP